MPNSTPLTQSFRTPVIMSLCSGYTHAGVTHTERAALYKFLTGKLLPPPLLHFDDFDIASEIQPLLAKQLPADLMAVINRKAQGQMYERQADGAIAKFPATYELRRPTTFWGFKAPPKDIDMQRVLREAPADARMVIITIGKLRFVYIRDAIRVAMNDIPYGWFSHTHGFIMQGADVQRVDWRYNGTLTGWRGMVFAADDINAIDKLRKRLADYDAAEAAKKAAEARKIEVKVESF